MTWSMNKIRRAFKTCKKIICCWKSEVNENREINYNYAVQHVYMNEQNSSAVPPEPPELPSARRQRRRPDIPTVKRRSVDPEKVAAVYRACKELRVPVDGMSLGGEEGDENNGDENEGERPQPKAVDEAIAGTA